MTSCLSGVKLECVSKSFSKHYPAVATSHSTREKGIVEGIVSKKITERIPLCSKPFSQTTENRKI